MRDGRIVRSYDLAMRPAILAAVFLTALAATAQVRESMTVEVIEVPVYVSAADGTPIRGLTKSAFTLLVNGKPQTIDYFDAIDYGAASANAETPKSAVVAAPMPPKDIRERRLYLLLFDLGFSPPGLIARAQQAADVAVARSNPATDYFAVATFTRTDGVKFVTPFSNDHVVIRRAINVLSGSDLHDPLGVGLSSERREKWARIEGRSQGKPLALTFGQGNDASQDDEAVEKVRGGLANQEIARQPERDDINKQMVGLGAAAARLAGLEGQKHVVIFSVGFDPTYINELGSKDAWRAPANIAANEDPQLRRFMEEMTRAFRNAGAFLDAINIVGQRGQAQDESLRRMAEPTGGQLVRNTNDLSEALNRLTTTQQVVYLLGFRRGNLASGDITVRVEGLPRGASLSYRNGFGKAQSGDMNSLQLADILINDVPQNGLNVELKAEESPEGEQLLVLYRPAEVAAQVNPNAAALDVMLYVFDEHGGIELARAKHIPIDPKTPAAPVAGVRQMVKLPPGNYVAKALLHVSGTQSAGFAKRTFTVGK